MTPDATTPADNSAVLLMAYGTPDTLGSVGDYFTHIRGGRPPSPEAVENLRRRYERLGGRTPLLDITRETAARLQESLSSGIAPGATAPRVYFGMKHWHPFIADTLRQMAADGVRDITAIALAPHYSRMSVGGYRKIVEETLPTLGESITVRFVDRWWNRPEFIEMMTALVRHGLAQFPEDVRSSVVAVFSAHSLPERIRTWNDPYEAELTASADAVAQSVGLSHWRWAWQSAGGSGEPWLGPDVLDFLETLAAEGVKNVLQVPIGFVSDHLEVLYDIDVEAKTKASELGMALHRTSLPNASPELVRTLAAAVRAEWSRPSDPALPVADRTSRASPV
jgi:protoporphyrin/coproporphyrin ferrochelatase